MFVILQAKIIKMSLEKRINTFVQLGQFLKQFKSGEKDQDISALNNLFYDDFLKVINTQKIYNGWFEKKNVLHAVDAFANSLTLSNINEWLSKYNLEDFNGDTPKKIGVIMAGNIPMVGFHDMLCVILSGNILLAKLSTNDNQLIRKIGEILLNINGDFEDKINFVDRLEGFDAVVATGSNNSARYFESYFGKYPNIIRKNRNSVAIIHQDDSSKELNNLGNDIFQYFGLGCRNVSKLYVPKGYDFDKFFKAIIDDFQNVTNNNKYANNYDYNKAVYLLGQNDLLDNGFMLLKEEKALSSPVGVLFYEYYEDADSLKKELEKQEQEIQCIVSSKNTPIDTFAFGEAQTPQLSDYADGVDTINFLVSL